MSVTLTGAELQDAARRLGLTQADVASATGLSIRTVNRLFNMRGPVAARSASIGAIAGLLGFYPPPAKGADPLMALELPLGTLHRARTQFPGLHALLEASRSTRCRAGILDRLSERYAPRLSLVALRDNELYFESIGCGIRWAGRHMEGQRTLSLPDSAVGRAATERYWKALITGRPVLQYVRTPLRLEFTALTVATGSPFGVGLVTVSALGRPAFNFGEQYSETG